jgi:diguanylate cyclase (GGDEF)-like protein/PAS domain S-box-containing protein
MTEEVILVVDDTRQIANFMADNILTSLGYRALRAYGGRAALELIRENHEQISLMLLDLEMPDMSGLEMLRKANEEGYNVPAIMVTAHGSEQIVVDAFRLGVHDYLKKPVEIDELSEAITRALSETRLRREKARLTAKLQEQVSWLTAISDVGQSVISTLNINSVLRRILEAGVALTQAEQGFIALMDSNSEQLYLRAVKNIDKEKVETVRLPVSDYLIKGAFETGRPVRRTRAPEGQSLKVSTGLLVYSLIHVPIRYHGRPLGVLSVNNHTQMENFTKGDETLLSFLADYAAIAIVNANSFEKVQLEIEERKRIETALRDSEERYALAVRGSNDGIWDWDLTTNHVYFSPRWKQMLGYPEDEIGSSSTEWFDRVHQDDLEYLKLDIATHLHKRTTHFTNEHRLSHKDGTMCWVLCRGMAVWADEKKTSHGAIRLAGSISDITDRKKAEDRLLHDAFHDSLTGLPNRALFMDRLNQTIERTKRQENFQFAVMFLDLDNFKDINDSIGHIIGDQVLIKVAESLKGGLRSIDTMARFGGDEFIILLDDIKDMNGVNRVTDWIREEFKKPIKVENYEVTTSASIGVVLSWDGLKNAEDIIRNADIAMYVAKSKGTAMVEVFEPSMRERFLERLNMEADLRKAIENKEFVVNYQPIVILESKELVGFEALIRWQHPEKGLLFPGDFITVAEETGIITEMDQWILGEACRQMADWNKQYIDNNGFTISINISGKHITNPELYDHIQQVLEETKLNPKNLKLEITELTIVDQNEFTVRALSNLRDMGVQIQIDDFGIGYSSLAYLSRFPINALKIDKSFVSRMGEEKSQLDIIRAIITLTERLNVNVIAEGVETEDQLKELTGLGCKLGQGYLVSKPLDTLKVESALSILCQDKSKHPIWSIDEETVAIQ